MKNIAPKLIGALLGALVFAAVGIGMAHAQNATHSDSAIVVNGAIR